MTTTRVAFVDVYVLRRSPRGVDVLLMRRAADRSRPGSWEVVHGRIDGGESPTEAARRELVEETGCQPLRLYNMSRVEQFYLHSTDEIALIPVFVAFIAADSPVTLNAEHDRLEWFSAAQACQRATWPRSARAIEDACRLFAGGESSAVEGVLRIE